MRSEDMDSERRIATVLLVVAAALVSLPFGGG